MTQTERRSLCPLCPSRRDPGKWTCRRCHARLWRELLVDLIDDAIEEAYGHSGGA